jgi:putative tricarboxylic transport membrane protein
MGIPGSGTTAVILGAIVMLGMKPGPLLFENNPDMVWTFINSMFIGNLFLVVLNIALVGLLVKILDTPPKTLYPMILLLAFMGTYTLNFSMTDFVILIIFGLIGLVMKILQFPVAPLILAVIVGSEMEQNLRKSLVSNDGVFGLITTSPITIVLVIMTIVSLGYPFLSTWMRNRKLERNMSR